MPLDPSISENKIFHKLLSSENYDLITKYPKSGGDGS